MADINTGAFSEALNLKADIDLRNIDTNKCDIVIEYQEPDPENDYKWYRLYASGWVEQGGTADTQNATINLPILMANTHYVVNCGFYIRNCGEQYVSKYTDRFVTGSNTNNSATFGGWVVQGMADMTHHEILPNPTSNTARALVIQVLEGMYPIGSVYLGTQSTCPMSVFFGTWELVSSGKALWTGDGTNANTTINAGLPNITGTIYYTKDTGYSSSPTLISSWTQEQSGDGNQPGIQGNVSTQKSGYGTFDASKSNAIYGNSNTVQPPAYIVNVWRRTA